MGWSVLYGSQLASLRGGAAPPPAVGSTLLKVDCQLCISSFRVVNCFSLGRRDEELMKQFTDERDVLESQIEMLQ